MYFHPLSPERLSRETLSGRLTLPAGLGAALLLAVESPRPPRRPAVVVVVAELAAPGRGVGDAGVAHGAEALLVLLGLAGIDGKVGLFLREGRRLDQALHRHRSD